MTSEWPRDGKPSFPTKVGHAGFDEHQFMGHQVFAELVGHVSPPELLALAILGRRLSPASLRLAYRISEIQSVADPRIPPLLATRLVASEGRALAGIACGLLSCVEGRIGPGIAGPVARMLLDCLGALGGAPAEAQLSAWLRKRKAAGLPLPGLGIPFRGVDERVAALNAAIEFDGHQGEHWKLCSQIQTTCLDAVGLPPNIGLLYGALCLDMGFDPRGASIFANMLGAHCFVANAVEGAEQQDEVLRQLPAAYIDYRGPAPRESPRAQAAREREPSEP